MPICEADPWRLQYFSHVTTAAKIPTEDSDAWQWCPAQRWIYDKLAVALSQGLDAGPHGTTPPRFPVFSKPIVNLKGMGVGSRVLKSQADYEAHYAPGHFWMTLLDGRHVSSDVAVVRGEPRWWRHVTGKPAGEGTFDYWIIHAEPDAGIEQPCGAWIEKNLPDYTGMLNVETIGGTIIEAHLRFADQWPDLYGPGWVDALVELYEIGAWNFADNDRAEGYSAVLFGPHVGSHVGLHVGSHGPRYRRPPARILEEVRHMPGVTSVQITFHEDRTPESHAMPPGGFRLAIVNGFDLSATLAARTRLQEWFDL